MKTKHARGGSAAATQRRERYSAAHEALLEAAGADGVASAVQRAKEVGQEVWEETRAQGLEAWADLGELVQKHPAKAVGTAVMAGLILGVALFRD